MNAATEAKHRTPPVPEGTVIADKYVVGRVLASGGMGIVAEGRHEALEQRVAIKFLLPETAKQGEAVARFLREARSAAKIESDHVVRVFDVGMHGDVPYMVMEYLEGADLDTVLERSGRLDLGQAVDLVTQALDGLARAHELGIVHRDLKPANLFVVDRGRSRRVKILDFGISKLMPESARVETGLTSTKSLMGSPGYMSPEQVRSTKNVDARTDVWSMGVILYELLTGEPAFSGESLGDIFAKIREEPLLPIRQKRPEIPPGLERVIMKCLEIDRARRFANAGELLEALTPFEAGSASLEVVGPRPVLGPRVADARSVADAPTIAADGPLPRKSPPTQSTWSRGNAAGSTRRWTVVGASMLAVAGLGAGVWVMSHPTQAIAPTQTSAQPREEPRAVGVGEASPTVEVRPAEAASSDPDASGVSPATSSAAPSASSAASPSGSGAPPRSGALPKRPVSPPSAPAPIEKPAAPSATPKKKDDLGI